MRIDTLYASIQPRALAAEPPPGAAARTAPGGTAPDTARAADGADISTARAWAQALAQRLDAQQAARNEQPAASEQPAAGPPRDSGALADALATALETVGQRLGQPTATASIGLLARRLGQGEITEDTLAQGLLDVLRLVDRTFGTAEGDALMATFNGGLNRALNDYFDNGLREVFYAAAPGAGATSPAQAVPGLVAQLRESLGRDAADMVAQILEQGLEHDPGYTGLRAALNRAGQALEAGHGPAAAQALSRAGGGMLAALGAPPRAPGLLLDATV